MLTLAGICSADGNVKPISASFASILAMTVSSESWDER
jgi:membrane protein DedA with SNARE-associated domain